MKQILKNIFHLFMAVPYLLFGLFMAFLVFFDWYCGSKPLPRRKL